MTTTYRYVMPVEETQWRLPATAEVSFTWDYEGRSAELLELYSKGKREQWDAEARIDWSLEVDPEDPMQMKEEVLPLFGTAQAAPPGVQVHVGKVPAISGAVGLDERAAMMGEYRRYNLHLAFALANGDFVPGVRVWIYEPGGELVWLGLSEGPLLFARLPQGRYRVVAEFEGDRVSRTLSVGQVSGPIHYLHWQ